MPIRRLPRLVLLLLLGGAAAAPVSAQGVVPNGDFDAATVAAWTGNTASLSWSQVDPDCLVPNASGSLSVSPEVPQSPATAFRCVGLPPAGTWNLFFLVRTECQELVKGILRYYPEAACGGALLGCEEIGAILPGGTWEQAELTAGSVPGGTQSIWIGLEISEPAASVCNALFDKIYFGPGVPLHRSGFETGATACRWSATVP